MYSALAVAILGLHLLFILWIVFGATFTRRRPRLRWLHLGSLVWGILIEILPWTCPLTWAENWLEVRAGIAPYQDGFLLHYLDVLVYPNIPPGLLTGIGVAVCIINRYLCSPFPAPRDRRLVGTCCVKTKARQRKRHRFQFIRAKRKRAGGTPALFLVRTMWR